MPTHLQRIASERFVSDPGEGFQNLLQRLTATSQNVREQGMISAPRNIGQLPEETLRGASGIRSLRTKDELQAEAIQNLMALGPNDLGGLAGVLRRPMNAIAPTSRLRTLLSGDPPSVPRMPKSPQSVSNTDAFGIADQARREFGTGRLGIPEDGFRLKFGKFSSENRITLNPGTPDHTGVPQLGASFHLLTNPGSKFKISTEELTDGINTVVSKAREIATRSRSPIKLNISGNGLDDVLRSSPGVQRWEGADGFTVSIRPDGTIGDLPASSISVLNKFGNRRDLTNMRFRYSAEDN